DGWRGGGFGLDLRIEKVEGPAAARRPPDGHMPLTVSQGADHLDGPVRPIDPSQRLLIERALRVDLVLPTVFVDALAAKALPVEKAHANQRQANVAGCLQVVARQDAEATGVNRQRLRQAEFQ